MPNSTDTLPDTWTVDEFAKFMDVAYKTALNAVKSGKVPGVIQLSERTYRIVPSAFMDGITGAGNRAGTLHLIEGGHDDV
jgi:hypothetical protein